MTVEIQTVGSDFGEPLAALSEATFKQAYVGVHSEANLQAYCDHHCSVAAIKQLLDDPKVNCRVAVRSGTAVGFQVTKAHPAPVPLSGAAMELKQIYVLASEFGGGTGGALFDDVISHAKAQNIAWLWLIVSAINFRAQRFYEKHSFGHIGDGPTLEVGTDRLDSFVLARALS